MPKLTSDKTLEYLPDLFETDIKGDINIFQKLEKLLVFDEGFIFYANPDSLQLKFSYKNTQIIILTTHLILINS